MSRPGGSRRKVQTGRGKQDARRPGSRVYLIRRLILLAALVGLGAGGVMLFLRVPEPAPDGPGTRISEPAVTTQAELFETTLRTQERLVAHQHEHGGAIPDDPRELGITSSIEVACLDLAVPADGAPRVDLERLLGKRPGLVVIERSGNARGRVWGIGRDSKGEATVLVRLMPPIP